MTMTIRPLDVGGEMMKSNITLLIALFSLLLLAACDCGDDDDDNDDNDTGVDDDDDATPDDDDDDDTIDDDTGDDDTIDDDTVDDDTIDDDTIDDDDTTLECDWDSYNPLMVAGKTSLGDYDPETAATNFNAAAAICPEVGDAQLGSLLAQFQDLVKTLQEVFGQYPEFPFIDWAAFQQSILDDLLPLNEGFIAAAETMQVDFPQNRLYVPSLPLLWSGETLVIDCGGEWDYADLLNLGAIGNLVDAIERFFLAFQLEADWTLLQSFPYLYDPIEIVHYFAGQILLMFQDPNYPDFFTFTDDGAQYFADFAISFGFAAIDGADGFAAVRDETDPQGDDITQYVDENDNYQWDEGEMYAIPFWGPLGDELNLFLMNTLILMADLGPALLDTGPEDLRPLLPDWLPLGDVNYILTALQGWVPGLSVPDIPIPVGYWLYNPPDDGLRTVMMTLVQFVYDYTAPKVEESRL